MRRAVLKEYDLLGESLSNYSAVFGYRLKNFCVKAEEVSLLPIKVLIEGELQLLEDCTTIGKPDEYSFMIFPRYDEDMTILGQSIMVAHPEFKQEIKSMTVDSVDEKGDPKEVDVRYLLLTMPEVDDDRYDLLTDGVKVCYDECKAQMEAAAAHADARFAELVVLESEEDKNKLEKGVEALKKQWNDHRDNIYNEKLQEIEDAHNKWLAEREARELKRQEEEASRGDSAAHSMKLDEMTN